MLLVWLSAGEVDVADAASCCCSNVMPLQPNRRERRRLLLAASGYAAIFALSVLEVFNQVCVHGLEFLGCRQNCKILGVVV